LADILKFPAHVLFILIDEISCPVHYTCAWKNGLSDLNTNHPVAIATV